MSASCDAILQFVTSSDVAALKKRLQPFVDALGAAVASCATLDPPTRDAWASFAASWKAYATAPETFWNAGAEFRTGCTYEATLRGWQQTLSSKCTVPGPAIPAPSGDMATAKTLLEGAAIGALAAVALVIVLRR